jgi:hypothetical protein
LFYDAIQYYLADGRCDPDYEAWDIEAEKRIFTEINNVISNRETLLLQEVDSLKQNFQEIKMDVALIQTMSSLLLLQEKTFEVSGI